LNARAAIMPLRSKSKRKAHKNVATHTRNPAKPKTIRTENLSAGEWFDKLVAVQKRLRAPKGCPWDIEQTHTSLRPYLIEEAYEVMDALDSGDDSKFADEMGDLLLQVVFHSEIARAENRFTVADVVRGIHDKMVRRHPHVFGDVQAKNSKEVLRNWEQIKAQERAAAGNATPKKEKPVSILDGVSRGLPATLQALQLTRKASRAGFDWENTAGIFDKLREEIAEVQHALADKNNSAAASKAEEELGDLLFAAVNLARFVQVDPEIALKKANAKFQRRFHNMEHAARDRSKDFAQLPREEMEALWNAVKHQEAERAAATGGEIAAKNQVSRYPVRNSIKSSIKRKAAASPAR
jgi:MazG family protein